MTYVTDQTSDEIRAHMRMLKALPGWNDPLSDRLFKEIQLLDAQAVDASRWRRLVNASEMAFPVAAISDDPENDGPMVYGRKRMESFMDGLDEIPNTYSE